VARTVALDTSSWPAEAKARLEAERSYQAAFKAHPLWGLVDQIDHEARVASEAARIHMRARDFGNGHQEVVFWKEAPDLERQAQRAIQRDLAHLVPKGEGDRERNKARAERRAVQQVRLLAKAMGVNSLLTFTYRANVQDRDLVLKHLDRLRRRMVDLFGEWRYLAVLEKQDRGAYHIHVGTHALPAFVHRAGVKLKSWPVMLQIWRHITGELGGSFHEAKHLKRWGSRKVKHGAGSIARYLAKYLSKDFAESDLNRKRFTRSQAVALPEAYKAQWEAAKVDVRELIELAFAGLGQRIARVWFDAERCVFFAESDDTAGVG